MTPVHAIVVACKIENGNCFALEDPSSDNGAEFFQVVDAGNGISVGGDHEFATRAEAEAHLDELIALGEAWPRQLSRL